MKKLLSCILLLFTSITIAQEYTLNKTLVNQFATGMSKEIILTTKLDTDGFYQIELNCLCSDESESFKLKPLTFPYFLSKLKDRIDKIVTTAINNDIVITKNRALDDTVVEKEASILFAKIATKFNTEEERPQVATIHLKNEEISVYYNTKNDSLRNIPSEDKLTDIQVEISFFGGFIEKMQVLGKFDGNTYAFNNKYSIGISSTKNIQQLSQYVLYSNEKITTSEFMFRRNPQKEDQPQLQNNSKRSLFIHVDDVIRYIKKVDINANDISPIPQVVLLDKNQKNSKLYREESSKLFEAVAFTDLIGLFDEENPNGLVQLEVKKRFNLNTRRFDRKWFHGIFPISFMFDGIGFFQNMDVFFQYSKIEENNKFLISETANIEDELGNITGTEEIYTPLTIMQYRNFAVGGTVNLVTYENQNTKLNLFLNAGALFGRTGIKLDPSDVEGQFFNNLEIPFEASILVLPEKRVSFSFTDRLSWFETFDDNLNIKSIDNGAAVNRNRLINSFNLDLNVDISASGKLFLRYKLIHEFENINNNFSMLQFGYSFYILKNNGTK